MKVFTDTNGEYVIRRGASFEVVSRRGSVQIEACTLSEKDFDEFTEALVGATRDAARLTGRPKYRPATTRRPKDGWLAALETK